MAAFCDIIDAADALKAEERAIESMKKELELKKKGYVIKQSSGDRARYWIRYEGRMLKKTKKEDLIEELYAMVFETVTLSRFWDSYLKDREQSMSERTLYKSKAQYDVYIRGTDLADIPIDAITIADLKAWIRHCREVSPDLTVKYFREIRSQVLGFARWAAEEKEIDVSTVLSYKPDLRAFRRAKRTPEAEAIFSSEEIKAVCAEARKDAWKRKQSITLIIPLLFATGMRRAEALALKWEDITALPDGTGTISISKQLLRDTDKHGRGTHIEEHAKSSSGERVLRIRGDVLNLLQEIRAVNRSQNCPAGDGDFIFMRYLKGRWQLHDPGTVFRQLKRLCPRAGMDIVKSPHDIRRTALTVMYRNGMGIKAVQKYAGHASVKQTYDYLRLSEEDVNLDCLPHVVTAGNSVDDTKAV